MKRINNLTDSEFIKNKEVKTNNVKTCTRTIDRNKNKFCLNSFWKLEKYSIIK